MRTNDTVDAVCANDRVGGSRRAVFEMDVYGTVLLVFELVDTLVEVGPVRWNALDELVEEVGPVHAPLARGVHLGVDELAFVFAFAL